jgi:hypothetical protein
MMKTQNDQRETNKDSRTGKEKAGQIEGFLSSTDDLADSLADYLA